MACTGGVQGRCRGEIDVDPPRGIDLKIRGGNAVRCAGRCGVPNRGTFDVGAEPGGKELRRDKRAGKRYSFPIKKFCIRDGKRVSVGRSFMTLVFKESGNLDPRKSDLNANGKPDGEEKRKK